MRIPSPAHLPLVPVKRTNGNGRAYRLSESSAPTHDGSPESTLAIVSWLAVEQHERWRPGGGQTFCNVYATDVAWLMGAYLPRVWWLPAALAEFARGTTPTVRYAATVGELSANALFRWLDQWSMHFGWRRSVSMDEAQLAANRGHCVVICARHKVEVSSGHISCVAPESDRARALRDGQGVLLPVQSQAGGRNVELGVTPPGAWWLSGSFAEWGIWIHGGEHALADTEPAPPPPETLRSLATTWDEGPATPLRAGEGEHTVPTEDPEL